MSEVDPFNTADARQLTAWTLRLGMDPVYQMVLAIDPQLFALFYAICASSVAPPAALDVAPAASAEGSSQVLATIKDLSRQFGSAPSARFSNLYLKGLAAYDQIENEKFVELCTQWHEAATRATNTRITTREQNIDYLGNLLKLDEAERRLLHFQLIRDLPGFTYLFDLLTTTPDSEQFVMSVMLDMSVTQLRDLLGEESKLITSGLVVADLHPFVMGAFSRTLRSVLTTSSDSLDHFMENFVGPLKPKASTASLARFDEVDERVLLKLMTLPVSKIGTHVLVYSDASVDKRDLLARLFEREGINAYIVKEKGVAPSDRPVWVHLAQSYLKKKRKSVLVIEHAEQVLASRAVSLRSFFGFELEDVNDEGPGKASDANLTEAPLRCVWLTNRSQSLAERNIGRFLFHAEALPGSRGDRRERIAKVVADANLGPDITAQLAKYSLLGEKPVQQAVRLANMIHDDGDEEARAQTVRRAVHQSQRALGRDQTEDLRESVTHYDLSLLNLNSRFSPQQIVASLRKRQKGSLLFHGLPGAGKTQFAEYLAVELDRPILIKRASDILDKWLGESEKRIAAMFKEAEEEGAILFLDEADSFLRDRSLARAEWSVTQVNELLQHLERANGVVICATNLMKDIDAAAMRRFTFKVEFLPMTPEQAWTMFCNEAKIDVTVSEEEQAALKAQLLRISHLTPGDFATCKRMAVIMSDEQEMTPTDWLEQLARESKDKMHGLERQNLTNGAYL